MKRMVGLLVATLMVMSLTTACAVAQSDEVPVIIGFKDKPMKADKDKILEKGGKIKHSYKMINAMAVKIPKHAIKELRKNPKVKYVEDDAEVHALEDTLPWGVDRIDADKVWGVEGIPNIQPGANTGAGVKVAIVDTGIDYNHPDLNDNYKGGYDFVNNDAFPRDDNGHGTHVAGTVAAEDNGFGVIGVAPGASLYAVKVLDKSGSGSVSGVIAGIEWAVQNDMDIISMSLGTDSDVQALHDIVDNANQTGVLLVAAAGNNNGGPISYPAAYESVIAVTATDSSDGIASFSSVGLEAELSAPGVDILSTYPGYRYASGSGTSMAAPHVTGVAALIMASDTTLTNIEVRQRLQNTADDLGNHGKDISYGYGLVDGDEAALIPDSTSPGKVVGVTATTVSSSTLDIAWNPNTESDLSYYKVYKSTTLDFNAGNLIASPGTNSYSDTGLPASTVYYYRVSAVDTSGNEGDWSDIAEGRTSDEAIVNTMHIASITITKRTIGKNTYAIATATVVDASEAPVQDALVSGRWSGLTTDPDSGNTTGNGQVSFSSDRIRKGHGTLTFTVESVAKLGWNYDQDSSETSAGITV